MKTPQNIPEEAFLKAAIEASGAHRFLPSVTFDAFTQMGEGQISESGII
jgi:hypothetical protein